MKTFYVTVSNAHGPFTVIIEAKSEQSAIRLVMAAEKCKRSEVKVW